MLDDDSDDDMIEIPGVDGPSTNSKRALGFRVENSDMVWRRRCSNVLCFADIRESTCSFLRRVQGWEKHLA